VVDWDLVPRVAYKLLNYRDKLPRTVLDDIVLAYLLRNDIQLLESLLLAVSTLVKQSIDDPELYDLVRRVLVSE
jgi:hypothetical protein